MNTEREETDEENPEKKIEIERIPEPMTFVQSEITPGEAVLRVQSAKLPAEELE